MQLRLCVLIKFWNENFERWAFMGISEWREVRLGSYLYAMYKYEKEIEVSFGGGA